MKSLGLMLLLGGMSAAVMAQGDGSAEVPEISGGSAASTLALISGTIAVLRSKRTKR